MKKVLVLLFLILSITGCSKIKELNYNENDLLYTCTDSDINLFKDDVNVNITDKQSFVYFNENSEMKEFTNGLLKFNDDNRVNVTRCYFVRKDEINNEFSSKSNIAFKDKVEGSMNLKLSGNYSFKIVDSKTFIEAYSAQDKFFNALESQINATFVVNMPSKTFEELSNEKEFDVSKLNALNNALTPKYGIKVIKVNINLERK